MPEDIKNKTLCFVGGADREKYCVWELSKQFNINVYGEIYKNIKAENITHFESIPKAVYNSEYVILPFPAITIEKTVSFEVLLDTIAKDTKKIIIGGLFTPYQTGLMQLKNIKYIDYFKNECFNIKNAYVTAEGALYLAMEKLNKMLSFSNCAILGYGRIGKALETLLSEMKADITVFARKDEALTSAKLNGSYTVKIDGSFNEILRKSPYFDIIFNTIPERIIENETLLALNQETILIELASAPGGFDFEIAKQSGINLINGGGIPNKYAPKSAGIILSDTIKNYIN